MTLIKSMRKSVKCETAAAGLAPATVGKAAARAQLAPSLQQAREQLFKSVSAQMFVAARQTLTEAESVCVACLAFYLSED